MRDSFSWDTLAKEDPIETGVGLKRGNSKEVTYMITLLKILDKEDQRRINSKFISASVDLTRAEAQLELGVDTGEECA